MTDFNKYIDKAKIPTWKRITQKQSIKTPYRRLLPNTRINPDKSGIFVAPTGENGFMSFSEFKKRKLKKGERYYFLRDGIYNFGGYDITVDDISFSAFGSGDDPIFSGSEDVSTITWTSIGGGVYTSTPDNPTLWLYGDIYSSNLEALKWAETDWLAIQSVPDTTHRIVNTAAAAIIEGYAQSVVGARMVGKEYNFRPTALNTITGYNSSTNSLAFTTAIATAELAATMPLKLLNQPQFITVDGDWVFTSGTLYLKAAADPSTLDIRSGIETFGIRVTGSSGFSVDNITFEHYQEHAIEIVSCPTPTIDNCLFRDCRCDGLYLRGNATVNSTITNLSFERIGLMGIELGAIQGATFNNLIFDSTGMNQNIGIPYNTNHTSGAAIALAGDASEATRVPNSINFTNITITNNAYCGTMLWGNGHTFDNVVVTDHCLKWNDGGGIYFIYRTSGVSATSNITITDCIVTGGVGNEDGISSPAGEAAQGFYLDNGVNDISMTNCTAINNSDCGFLINWDTKDSSVINCLSVGNGHYQVFYRQDTDPADSPVWPNNNGNILTGTIMVCTSPSQRCVIAWSRNNVSTFNPFTGGDSNNNAYVQPYSTSVASYRQVNTITDYTLSGWRTKMGDDGSSTERVNYIVYTNEGNAAVEVMTEINNTASPVNFNVPVGYSDETGTPYSNPVSIGAFSALVYLKDTAA